MKAALDAFLADFDFAAHRARDPVAFVWRFTDPLDQELVAVFAACLAYGRVASIANGLEDVLRRIGPTPARTAAQDDEAAALARFDGFVYRMTRGVDLTRVWRGIAHLQRVHGSLGEALAAHDPGGPDLRQALAGWRGALLEPTAHFPARRSFEHFFSDPLKGSPIKRISLLLRWMVRGPDAVDLGLWRGLGAHRLVIPVDTHVHRISRYLGLTRRKSADWRTAAEITAALRRFDPADPLRYDFALAHLGISGACPTRRMPAICQDCPIEAICTL